MCPKSTIAANNGSPRHGMTIQAALCKPPRTVFWNALLAAVVLAAPCTGRAGDSKTAIQSPDGRNSIVLEAADDKDSHVRFTISRDGHALIGPSPLGPVLSNSGPLCTGARVVDVARGKVDESFQLPWGKTRTVINRCSKAVVTLT